MKGTTKRLRRQLLPIDTPFARTLVCGVQPAELALVAAHAWDIHGANRAGLVTGWVTRDDGSFPSVMETADVQGRTLTEVATSLTGLS